LDEINFIVVLLTTTKSLEYKVLHFFIYRAMTPFLPKGLSASLNMQKYKKHRNRLASYAMLDYLEIILKKITMINVILVHIRKT
jgi:hypothetical protein